jgi:hypothetical protein
LSMKVRIPDTPDINRVRGERVFRMKDRERGIESEVCERERERDGERGVKERERDVAKFSTNISSNVLHP